MDEQGRIYGDSGDRATVWIDRKPVDLNDLVDPADHWKLRGMVLRHAFAGNGRGEILAWGALADASGWHVVILRPR
jgi:hypothetical protein